MDEERDNGKQKILNDIRIQLNKYIKNQRLNQKEILERCAKNGFEISQSEISRILSGKTGITLYQAMALSKTLDISLDRLAFSSDYEEETRLKVPGTSFIEDPVKREFNGYTGTFHVYFQSTSRYEDKILNGTLRFEPDKEERICKAYFDLCTGEKEIGGKEKVKQYTGQLIISKRVETAYCILACKEIGEISLICFRHRDFFVKNVLCKVGLSLTVSAGDKTPVVHQLFISRRNWEEDKEKMIIQLLRMSQSAILIPEDKRENLPREYADLFEAISRDKKGYYEINIQALMDKRISSRKEKLEFLSLLEELAEVPSDFRLSGEMDRFLYFLYSIYDEEKV